MALRKLAWKLLYDFTAQAPERGGFGPDDIDRAVAALEASRRGVTIGCVHCGREIWQSAPDWTTLGQIRAAQCSDCFLARARGEAAVESATSQNAGATPSDTPQAVGAQQSSSSSLLSPVEPVNLRELIADAYAFATQTSDTTAREHFVEIGERLRRLSPVEGRQEDEQEAAFKAGYHCRWHREQGFYCFDPAMSPGDPDGAYAAWLKTDAKENE